MGNNLYEDEDKTGRVVDEIKLLGSGPSNIECAFINQLKSNGHVMRAFSDLQKKVDLLEKELRRKSEDLKNALEKINRMEE